jgi:integrase
VTSGFLLVLLIGSQTALVTANPNALPDRSLGLENLADAALRYANATRAASTERAYTSDWEDFAEFTQFFQRTPLPADPETVVFYVTHLADTMRPSTIDRRLAAISVWHRRNGYQTPTANPAVREVMKGIRRKLKVAQKEVAPATIGDIRRMVAHLPIDRLAIRDKALLLVGFAGALRRSELVAITVDDLLHRPEGVLIALQVSKTDQEGEGRRVAIPLGRDSTTCPVSALKAWLTEAGIREGPVFRAVDRHGNVSAKALSDRAVALMIKRRAEEAGLDPNLYSGHSLRAGFATTAAANGATERAIANQTGHRSMEVLRRYIRMGTVWSDNAATTLGL